MRTVVMDYIQCGMGCIQATLVLVQLMEAGQLTALRLRQGTIDNGGVHSTPPMVASYYVEDSDGLIQVIRLKQTTPSTWLVFSLGL